MATEARLIRPGSRVRLHLEILLADGTQALTSFEGDAVDFTLGDGTLAPGLENLLTGLQAGDDERIIADGSQLFGPREEASIHWLPRSSFSANRDLAEGQLIAFETPGGQEIAGVLLEADSQRVRVDFNHPLSGRSLHIRAQVISVADPREDVKQAPEK